MSLAQRMRSSHRARRRCRSSRSAYPQFVAALSFLPALPPGQVASLLGERLQHLAMEEARAAATRELMQKRGLPRLLWVEEEYRDRLRAAEIGYVRSLIRDIET